MNIGLITGTFLPKVGGVEWKVHYLASEYIRQGHSVTVFAPRLSIKSKPLPVTPGYKLVRYGYSMRGLGVLGLDGCLIRRTVIKKHRLTPFDVLHCHHLALPTSHGVDIKKRIRVPVVATTCGDDVQTDKKMNYGVRLRPRFDRMVRHNLKTIDVVGSISKSVRKDLESMQPTARIVDIPNGVDWDNFQVDSDRQFRDKLGLRQEDLLILSVGRNHIKKGYALGIRAFAQIASRFPNVYYAFVGRDTTELATLAEQLKLKRQIRLVEQVPMSEMPYVYHSADIFFNPSLVEGFAQVNAQALACGLPCVLTNAPGNGDAAHYGGALVAQTEDVDSMAENLAQIISDTGFRNQLRDQAYQAGKNYSWRVIAEQYLEVFQDLIEQG